MTAVRIRELRESDYPVLIRRVDDWWGRPISHMLPRLFLRHFHATSLAAVGDSGETVGFLVGIVSPSEPGEAHTHFIAVSPEHRRSGLGRTLYERFFALAKERDCRTVTAVVSPVNTRSQRFHLSVGFQPVPLDEAAGAGGAAAELPVWKDWDGPGEDRIRFSYAL
ncbi:GNAT family N-acetyltransferase [Streptomyces sp. NPDC052101]|uniref:GNAT family N-acetyltransferase n=1 Tax=Streptomyces sp. NPDC052101 TaxID=3155763 RepID=UPI0034275E37